MAEYSPICEGTTVPLEPEEVGARIRAARKAKGWTIEQLAREMGVHWRTVQRWQTGRDKKSGKVTLPRVTGEKSLLRLAEVLEVPPGYLVEQEDPQVALRDLAGQVAALDERMSRIQLLLSELLARVDGGAPARSGEGRARAQRQHR